MRGARAQQLFVNSNISKTLQLKYHTVVQFHIHKYNIYQYQVHCHLEIMYIHTTTQHKNLKRELTIIPTFCTITIKVTVTGNSTKVNKLGRWINWA